MKEKDFIHINVEAAEIEAMEFATRFAHAISCIKWLKEENLPLYWEILWDCLASGNLLEAYRIRYAKDNYLNINDLQVKNDLMAKFHGLHDPADRYKFPQKFVKRNKDGSIEDIDRQKIEDYFKDRYTYVIPAKTWQLVENIREALEKLDADPIVVSRCFFKEGDKIEILLNQISELIN